jgi:undecaprenyl-diphosphatase
MISVKYFIQIVQKSGFAIFGWYRIALGALILGLILTHHI